MSIRSHPMNENLERQRLRQQYRENHCAPLL